MAKPIAVYPMCADFGVEIVGIETSPVDALKWRYSNEKRLRRSIVRFDANGENGKFRAGRVWIPLADLMKCA